MGELRHICNYPINAVFERRVRISERVLALQLGSNLAAGSDSELGSSLHWTAVRDIAEEIVQRACRAQDAA